jgi:hypothetical protein
MEHKIINEKLQLYFFDELPQKEKAEVEKHLLECNECKKDLREMERLRVFLSMKKKEVADNLLNEARQELKVRLRQEKRRQTLVSRIKELFVPLTSLKPAYVLGIIAVFASGILIGSVMFRSGSNGYGPELPVAGAGNEAPVKISNVKFIDSDASDGEVEFSFNAVKPVRVKGNINDDKIKSVLMYAMLNEENPGIRLNTVNLINESRPAQVDSEVKTAVIAVAKYDDNPGVRKEAFTFMKKLPFDEDIKSAYLYVLMNDSVSGLRIEAINGLFEASQNGELFTKEELSVFKEKMQEDENSYIRLRAQTVLKEYN